MTSNQTVRAALLACLATGTVAGCSGADGVASPGEGVFVSSPPTVIINPPPTVTPPTVTPPVAPPTVQAPTNPNDIVFLSSFSAFPTTGVTGKIYIAQDTGATYRWTGTTYQQVTVSGGTGAAASCPSSVFINAGIITTGSGNQLRNCQLPSRVTGTLLVPQVAGTIYSMSGRVDVGQDLGPNPSAPISGATAGVLSIEPGVTLFGSGSLDYLVVNRGSQINAVGTAGSPIVFTSRQSIEGNAGVDSIGQWGGLVILGRAPTSDGCPTGTVAPSILCDAVIEGAAANYGGVTSTDNSGRLSYVRVQHSGFEVLPGNELNGITFGGVGNGTVVDHVQVHNSSDDGIEIFGGTLNLSHIVLTGNDDDSYDLDSGWRGGTQYLLAVQRPNGGDRVFELSSRGAKGTPAGSPLAFPFNTIPRISNATLVGRASTGDTILINSGNGLRLANSVVTRLGTGGACLDIDDADTTVASPTFNSVFMSCTTAFRADGNQQTETQTLFDASTNEVSAGTSTLTAIATGAVAFVNGANETAVTVTSVSNSTYSTSFTNPTRIGAVSATTDTWYRGWTCSALIGEEAC